MQIINRKENKLSPHLFTCRSSIFHSEILVFHSSNIPTFLSDNKLFDLSVLPVNKIKKIGKTTMKQKPFILVGLILIYNPLFSQSSRVEPQRIWQNFAARTDWASKIAFDYIGSDGFFDLAVSNFRKTYLHMLTHEIPDIPQRHNGNPTIHQTGRYVVFQALKDSTLGGDENRAWFTYAVDSYKGSPGKGLDNDLWCVDLLDTSFYRLTFLPTKKTLLDTTKITGILHPHFSKDGTKVLWAQAYDVLENIGSRGHWGLWQLNISDFVINGSAPHLQNTISFKPGGILGDFTWCESHGWAKKDSVVIFSMNAEGQHENYMDIYTLNIFDSTLVRLTDDPQTWDEHAHTTHDEEKLIWICSKGYNFDTSDPEGTLKTDYWMMNMDGTNKEKVTFFNDPSHSDYQIHGGQRVICADASFSPTGDSLLINTKLLEDPSGVYEKIMIAQYNPSTGITISEKKPMQFTLDQNYPNPFNTSSRITYSLSQPDIICLKIFNSLGKEIHTLVNQIQDAGNYSVTIDTKDFASGVYLYVLQAGNRVLETKKMILLK
jgi:hypothetical protein